ncbi:hypothetical protein ACFX15_035045 [Malus domestica]
MADVSPRHVAFGLSGWQFVPGLLLGFGLSIGLPHAGALSSSSAALFKGLPPEHQPTLELLLRNKGKVSVHHFHHVKYITHFHHVKYITHFHHVKYIASNRY